MAKEVPTTEPQEILAGDTLQWDKSLSDYPASEGYTLKYRLINAAGKIDITSTADGDDYSISVAASVTAAYTAGIYTWTSFVEKGTAGSVGPPAVEDTLERYTIAQGTITIKPSLATQSAGLDTRSHAKICLDAIEAVMEGRATRSDLQYSIGNRQLQHMTHSELIKARNYYKGEYQVELGAEAAALGKSTKNKISVRFKRA